MVTRTKMLEMMAEAGLDNFGEWSDDVLGWFGWELVGDILSVVVEHADGAETRFHYRLSPID